MDVLKITSENFEQEVINADKMVVVDFYADWCGPCKMMAPIIEEIAKELEGKAKVGKDAFILSNNDYATISGFGRENRTTTFYLSHNNIIMVDCGCFKGTLDEFENKVNKTHKK